MDVIRVESANVQASVQQPQAQAHAVVSMPPPVQMQPRQEQPQTLANDTGRHDDDERSQYPLTRAVAAINTALSSYMRHISINFHRPTGRNIVTVYDSATNQAIRQIPPEKVLDAHAGLLELAGLLMDARG